MKTLGKHHVVFIVFVSSLLLLSSLPVVGWNSVWAAGAVYRVDHSAPGLETGLNWKDAFLTLQDALDVAAVGDEIWVAGGVYKPTKQTDAGDARTATFLLTEGVEIYGGFAGGEGSKTDRNWELNKTILSGDLDSNDTNVVANDGITLKHNFIVGNNAYNVVQGNNAITYTTATVLDGFVITGGKTKAKNQGGVNYGDIDGAGIRFAENASLILRNLWVVGHVSEDDGGAIHFAHSNSPVLENITVESASAKDFTGGIYFENDNNPTFLNVTVKDTVGRYSSGIYLHVRNTATFANLNVCRNHSTNSSANSGSDGGGNAGTGLSFASENAIVVMNGVFAANTAGERGGGIRMKRDNNVQLHNVSVSGNQATEGGGIYIRNTGNVVTITNSVIWGNDGDLVADEPVNLTVRHSLIGSSATPYTGTGNVSSTISPFVNDPEDGVDNIWGTEDDDCGDLRLKASATAVDTGSNSHLPADTLDINNNNDTAETLPLDLDGQFRIHPTTVDMGAYERSISPKQQTITFTLSAAAQSGLSIGSQENLVATATSGLPVIFGSDTPSVCSVSGSTATMLDSGICSVTASQYGDGTYAAAPEVTRSILVSEESKLNQTITIASPVEGSTHFVNDVVSLVASSSSGLTVVFSSGTPSICSVSGSSAMMLQAGGCTIHANQAGDDAYNPAPQKSVSITIAKKSQTITFSNPAVGANAFVGEDVVLMGTASSGLAVAFSSNTPSICSVSGGTASMLAEGSCQLVASQGGNGEYNAAVPVVRSVAVGSASKINQTITFSTPADMSEAAKSAVVSLAATASSGLQVTFASDTPEICTVAGPLAIMNNFGACQISANQAGDDAYNPAPSVVHTVFVKQPQSINFPTPPAAANAEKGSSFELDANTSSGLNVSYSSLTPAVCTVSNTTVQLLAPGLCQIQANQIGDDRWLGAQPASITFSVGGDFLIFLSLITR